jgi:hypothetical protein
MSLGSGCWTWGTTTAAGRWPKSDPPAQSPARRDTTLGAWPAPMAVIWTLSMQAPPEPPDVAEMKE